MRSAAPPPAKEVDPRLNAVADWLRNEKQSGLHTKEAVQYEKVRRRSARLMPPVARRTRLFFAAGSLVFSF